MINIRFESGFNPEKPTKEYVIDLFKSGGETVEAFAAYSLWFDEKKKEVDESGSKYAQLIFNIEVCDLLVEACLVLEADEYLETTWLMLTSEESRFPQGDIPEELQRLRTALEVVSSKLD